MFKTVNKTFVLHTGIYIFIPGRLSIQITNFNYKKNLILAYLKNTFQTISVK